MIGPYQILGISPAASQEEIRHAYHELVKRWHPDRFQDEAKKAEAQEKLIAINAAYEHAMKLCVTRFAPPIYTMELDQEDAKAVARKMMARSSPAGALRELLRASQRDAGWYALQGEILSAMGQLESAMQSWREAVRREPDNMTYRRGALAAEMAFKKSKTVLGRVKKAFSGLKK